MDGYYQQVLTEQIFYHLHRSVKYLNVHKYTKILHLGKKFRHVFIIDVWRNERKKNPNDLP